MPPLNQQQINELAIAQNRNQAGTPGVATDVNAGDVANLKYAESKIGAGNVANIQDIAKIGTGSPFSAPVAEVSDGTDSNWDQYNKNKNNISGSITEAKDSQESSASVVDRMTQMYKNISGMTTAQEEQIKEAGKSAGDAYNARLEEARFAREQELPKDVVRAGQRGGFENTQMAGIAAVTPVKGDSFIGAGGILSESRQAMDRNISMIVDAQKQAIQAAEAAERKYIQSGKREDYNAAMDLVKLSNDMENDKETIRMNREQLDISKKREDRLNTAAEFDLISQIPAGETQTINGVDYTGIAVEDIDPFFSGANILSAMKDIPDGEWRELYDPYSGQLVPVMGIASEDPNIEKKFSYNDSGEAIITSYRVNDDGSLQLLDQVSAGKIGKTKTQAANVSLTMKADTKAIKQSITNNLETARDPETGYIPEKAYFDQYLTFLNSDLGDVGDFRAQYAPNMYFSPEDAKEINRIFSEAEAGTATLTKDDDDDDAFEFKPVGE